MATGIARQCLCGNSQLIKRLLYTAGEPSGIGPDLALLYATQKNVANKAIDQPFELVTIADPDLLLLRASQLNLSIQLKEVNIDEQPTVSKPSELPIIPVKTAKPVQSGNPDIINAAYVLKTLDIAIDACLNHQSHAMVTGPIQKSIINDSGIAFSGHTEYLAQKTHTEQVVMMLATQGLRVALATTHLPLKDVPTAITQPLLTQVISILDGDLRDKFGIDKPNILVCGLNPHAGENGHLGKEELEVIIPTLEQLTDDGIACIGPLPADTLFTPKHLDHADAVLAMYHDQGLPVLKYKGFGSAANITLGLPIIRTSVDHGTALDLAGTGNIDLGSLLTAIDYALAMNPSNPIISEPQKL